MKSLRRKWWAYLLGAVALVFVVFTLFASSSSAVDANLTQFLADVQAGRVARVEVNGQAVDYELRGDSVTYTTELERGDTVRSVLADAGVQPNSPNYPTIVVDSGGVGSVLSLILQFFPVLLILGIVLFFLRQANKAQSRPPLAMMVTNFDPVCRATVNPGSAEGSSTFMQTTYYFCSADHKQRFDADPTQYLLNK